MRGTVGNTDGDELRSWLLRLMAGRSMDIEAAVQILTRPPEEVDGLIRNMLHIEAGLKTTSESLSLFSQRA